MTPTTTELPVVKDAVWQTWLEKGRRNDHATARKFKIAVGIVLFLLILAIVFHFSSVK
jgi:hypothetical protein